MPIYAIVDKATGKTIGGEISAPGAPSALSHYLATTKHRYPGTKRVDPLNATRPPGSNIRHLTVRAVA